MHPVDPVERSPDLSRLRLGTLSSGRGEDIQAEFSERISLGSGLGLGPGQGLSRVW